MQELVFSTPNPKCSNRTCFSLSINTVHENAEEQAGLKFFFGEDLRFSAHRKKFDNNIQKENAKSQSKLNIDAKIQEEREFKKEAEKYSNMTKDELLLKMIQLQNKQINLFENQIKKQNEQTEALYKIRWAIITLLIFIVGQTIVLKMKLGL